MPVHIYGDPSAGLQFEANDFVGFAIGAMSDFDQVRIDGELLCAGRMLMLRSKVPKVSYVRGPTSRPADAFTDAAYTAHLIGFTCRDLVVNPGPRASRTFRRYVANLAAVDPLILRAPFTGRRHGRVRVVPISGAVTYYVRGLQWVGADQNAQDGDHPVLASALIGSAASLVTVTAAAADANDGYFTGEGRHIGGTNDAEYCDEIEIVAAVADETATECYIELEVTGEEGCA